MKVGFARVCITPGKGTRLFGWSDRDAAGDYETIHDDLYATVAWFEHEGEAALVAGLDLLFFDRAQADRYTAAIGRALDLRPRQVLLNTSHTHNGPMLGMGAWAWADYLEPERLYGGQLAKALVWAARQAAARAVPVTLWAGTGTSDIAMNRRRLDSQGRAQFVPNPQGPTDKQIPILAAKDERGRIVALLYSVACHLSSVHCNAVSADFAGVACRLINEHLGSEAALFLQGCGADAKVRVPEDSAAWRSLTWQEMAAAGREVAEGVIAALDSGLRPIEPRIVTALTEVELPLAPPPDEAALRRSADDPQTPQLCRLWAQRQLQRLAAGERLPREARMLLHGVQLGAGCRLVGWEAEAVAGIAPLVRAEFDGVTFVLGCTNGAQFYLPLDHMLAEGGYEVDSAWEYGHPASIAAGIDQRLGAGVATLRQQGIR